MPEVFKLCRIPCLFFHLRQFFYILLSLRLSDKTMSLFQINVNLFLFGLLTLGKVQNPFYLVFSRYFVAEIKFSSFLIFYKQHNFTYSVRGAT